MENDPDAVIKSLTLLRNDALKLGYKDLAIVCGWSLIRLTGDKLGRQLNDIRKRDGQ